MGATTSFVISSFLGGEISQAAQGQMGAPAYKISMNVCLNGIPIESGAWLRRPGTQLAAHTRGGGRGRGITFTFEQSSPYVMEFTDGFLRFTDGPALVMTNDQQAVVAISSANPAVVQTTTAHGWSTGNQGMFNSLGVNNPLLQNRQFTFTVVDSTHVSLTDAITGSTIDGSTLGAFVSGNLSRILEIATNYSAGSWISLRSVQAEERTVLLNGTLPQVLEVASNPTTARSATFTYGPADFIDGPYLDPIPGSIMTPGSGQVNGLVTFTLSFTAYDSTRAYNIGDFVSSSGVSYQSLTEPNQGHTPASSPSNWQAVNAGSAVNDGLGFVASDVGRLIRLFCEPQQWSSGATYTVNQVVSYPDGSGGNSYWSATGSVSAGIVPGTSTLWAINATAAQWTWAQITAVSGTGIIAPQTAIGTLTQGGGVSAAFDGTTSKTFAGGSAITVNFIATYPVYAPVSYATSAIVQYNSGIFQAQLPIIPSASAPAWNASNVYHSGDTVLYTLYTSGSGILYLWQAQTLIGIGAAPPGSNPNWTQLAAVSTAAPAAPLWSNQGTLPSPTYSSMIGQHYTSGIAISSATLYPSSDIGLANVIGPYIIVNLRASNSAPASPSNGTLLNTTGSFGNQTAPLTIGSNDTVSTWTYVWLEIITTFNQPLPDNGSHTYTADIGLAQVQFYSPNVSNGSVITAQIRGPALLYANQAINLWRNGVYSGTTGYPTCGTYHEGRPWFGGVVSNRFDAGVSNGIAGTEINFAPTAPDGTVTDANAISYTCDGEGVNQIFWMKPDQQGILFCTQEGPWLISAPSPGAMSPTNIKAVRVNGAGSANIEPRRSEHTLLYVHRYNRKLMESFADVFSGKFSSPNLSERAKHLTVSGIAEIAYQEELAPIIWARLNNGNLIGATYKRDTLTTSQGPNIIGWHRHALGSGRLVESICVGPSQDGNLDTLSMVTNDLNTGIRHIELMTDLLDEGFALTNCWFLDDAIVPSSNVVQAAPTGGAFGSLLVNGLWPLNGKTVTAYIAGLDCGDYAVSNGSITVPFGDGTSGGTANGLFTAALVQSFATLPAVVGFTYNSDGQIVRPVSSAETGAQAGPGWAKTTRMHRAAAQLYGCVNGSISFGTDFNTLYAAKLRFPNDAAYAINQPYSGIWRDTINSIYGFDSNMLSWRIGRPNPAFIMAVGGFVETQDI